MKFFQKIVYNFKCNKHNNIDIDNIDDKIIYDNLNKIFNDTQINNNNFDNLYTKNCNIVLGSGNFGKVFLGKNTNTNNKIAYKCINDEKDTTLYAVREITNLNLLNNCNIIKLLDYNILTNKKILILELCEGKELFDYIINQRYLNENTAKKIIKIIINTVDYCHSMLIMHRDIKPENIMFKFYRNYNPKNIKLIDFGLSKKVLDVKQMNKTQVGTSYYLSPEIIKCNYTISCDIWSIGILLYVMLEGHYPFANESTYKTYKTILKLKYKFYNKISNNTKKIIKKLLVYEKNRISLNTLMSLEWYKQIKI